MPLRIEEADAGRFDDIARVLGDKGAVGGCWCMFWRLTNQQIAGKTADDNRALLAALVASDGPSGLLAYDGDEPVGWCSIAPRTTFPRLFHTKGITVDAPDDPGVWSLVCVYVARGHRGGGMADELVSAAVDYAETRGATVVEGYPVLDPTQGRSSGLSTGTIGLFRRAGFTVEAAPPTGRRTVARLTLT